MSDSLRILGVKASFFKRLPAVCAGYIDLAGCPDDSAVAGADIFDASASGASVVTVQSVSGAPHGTAQLLNLNDEEYIYLECVEDNLS